MLQWRWRPCRETMSWITDDVKAALSSHCSPFHCRRRQYFMLLDSTHRSSLTGVHIQLVFVYDRCSKSSIPQSRPRYVLYRHLDNREIAIFWWIRTRLSCISAVRHLGFLKLTFNGLRDMICIIVPNVVEISHTDAEISRFFWVFPMIALNMAQLCHS